jgi:NADH:ubiquinone oxidoreductase subunit 6 (subunit J)
MDSPHAIGFYASSALALGGALVVVFAGGRGLRSLALLISGVGVAGVYASLSAGFAALVVLASFAGSALLLARPDYRTVMGGAAHVWRQLAAVGAAILLAALAYAAFRGDFAHVTFNGGFFGSAAVGRLLFARDALAAEAVGALVLAALAGLTVAWRVHDRSR